MHGNVAEIVADAYVSYSSAATVEDPKGPIPNALTTTEGGPKFRRATTRGGAWINPATPSAYRFSVSDETVGPAIGFRVVCEIAAPRETRSEKGHERGRASGSKRPRKR